MYTIQVPESTFFSASFTIRPLSPLKRTMGLRDEYNIEIMQEQRTSVPSLCQNKYYKGGMLQQPKCEHSVDLRDVLTASAETILSGSNI